MLKLSPLENHCPQSRGRGRQEFLCRQCLSYFRNTWGPFSWFSIFYRLELAVPFQFNSRVLADLRLSLLKSLIDWLIDWIIEWMNEWMIDRPIDWLIDCRWRVIKFRSKANINHLVLFTVPSFELSRKAIIKC